MTLRIFFFFLFVCVCEWEKGWEPVSFYLHGMDRIEVEGRKSVDFIIVCMHVRFCLFSYGNIMPNCQNW